MTEERKGGRTVYSVTESRDLNDMEEDLVKKRHFGVPSNEGREIQRFTTKSRRD